MKRKAQQTENLSIKKEIIGVVSSVHTAVVKYNTITGTPGDTVTTSTCML